MDFSENLDEKLQENEMNQRLEDDGKPNEMSITDDKKAQEWINNDNGENINLKIGENNNK